MSKVEPIFPPGHETLEKLRQVRPDIFAEMVKMAEVSLAKGHDYSGEGKTFQDNLHAAEEFGMPAWVGVALRMNDKMARLKSFARQGELQVKDESIEDTFRDLALYGILGLIVYRTRKGHQEVHWRQDG